MRVLQSIDSRLVTLLLAAILIVGTLGIVRPDTFLSPLNINSMLLQSSVIGLLSLAVAVTMLTGGIDLSINATANVTSIVVATLLSKMVPAEGGNATLAITALALVVGLLVGFGCGLFNGFLIAILGYSPILATLGTMTLFVGIGTVLTGGNTLFGISAFATVGRGFCSRYTTTCNHLLVGSTCAVTRARSKTIRFLSYTSMVRMNRRQGSRGSMSTACFSAFMLSAEYCRLLPV